MTATNAATTLLSLLALLFSAYSLYESTLKAPQLEIFVAPRIDYTDPDRPEAVREVFVLPVTIANDGARSATVQSITLEVTNPRTKETKAFYPARLGSWGEVPVKPFAPVVLAGKASYSQAVQFEPRLGERVARILDQEAGSYVLKLTLDLAGVGQAGSRGHAPLQFEMQIGELDYRAFQGIGTMAMWSPDYRPPATPRR
jgi:hypothetical protein